MAKLNELKRHLKRGKVYRRADLTEWSKSVDRHLEELVKEGTLQKIAPGVYYCPKTSVFGTIPPNESDLVGTFLKDDRFLLLSPNLYNSLGVGTSQLYNKKVVYNHKRHGKFRLGNRDFDFQVKHHFPSKLTEEFLLVDLANNLEHLAEDNNDVQNKLLAKASKMPAKALQKTVTKYGNAKTKKLFKPLISETSEHA